MSARVTRRRLLLGGGALAVFAALGGVLAIPDEISLVRGIVRAQLPDLLMDEADEVLFAEEFLAYYRRTSDAGGENSLRVVRALAIVPDAMTPLLPNAIRWADAGFASNALRMFLLSTDYLEAREEPGRKAQYIVIADPYFAGCANPWARFDTA